MAISTGNKVEFVYLKSGKKYPDNVGTVKDNVVYFEEDTQKIHVNGTAFGGSDEDIAAFLNSWGITYDSPLVKIANNLKVDGDLEVTGTTTIVDVNQIHVDDNIILLNSNLDSGLPVAQSGIVIKRGSETSAGLFLDEMAGSSIFKVGTYNHMTHIFTGNAVLLRDDFPIANGIFAWNNSTKRAETIGLGTNGQFFKTNGSVPGWEYINASDINDSGALGRNIVQLSNSNGFRFLVVENNTVTLATDSEFRTAIGAGTGSVTSVGLSLPNIFNVTVSPITTTGSLAATLANQTPNTIFAGPTEGMATTPTFRALVAADLPAAHGDSKNPYASKTKNYVLAAPGNTNGVPSFRALTVDDISNIATTYLKLNGDNYMTGALKFDSSGDSKLQTDGNGDLEIYSKNDILLASTLWAKDINIRNTAKLKFQSAGDIYQNSGTIYIDGTSSFSGLITSLNGIAMSSQKITGLAAGTADADAATYKQVKDVATTWDVI